jgi:AcrR family transcriptional regulator
VGTETGISKRRDASPGYGVEAVPSPSQITRTRMLPQDRERHIIDHAMRFFAEQGLDGHTRELAQRLGITQSLIYCYFPSKDALIERVYERCWQEFWNPDWPDWISDRRQPLEHRLSRFFHDYSRVVYNYVWVRLFAFSGLNGRSYHSRFVDRNREQIYPRIAGELRHDFGLPSLEEMPLTVFEGELIWSVQATAFQVGQRKWLFDLPVPFEIEAVVEARMRAFLNSAPQQIGAHLAALRSLKMASD